MKQNAAILNNSYNSVTRGAERTSQNSAITISPLVDIYEESTTEDISNLYDMSKLYEILYDAFEKSPYFEKYGKPILKKKYQLEKKEKLTNDFIIGEEDTLDEEIDTEENGAMYGVDDYTKDSSAMEKYVFRSVEKSDISPLYYYFKDIIVNNHGYNELDAFCAIAEFFKLNYGSLYNDVISIENKARILEILKENHRLGQEFKQTNRLY